MSEVPVPFKDQNIDQTLTVQASAVTGDAIILTASAAIFTADMVQRYFYLEQPAADSIKPWVTNTAYTTGERVRSDGRNYACVSAATSGNVKPTHTTGAKFDGHPGVQWLYTDDGYGILGILSIANDGLTAIAAHAKQLPAECVSAASHRWAKAAWNDTDGYPTSVAFFRERLCFARGQTIWCSVTGDFENFQQIDAGEVTADMSVTATIAASENDRILWLASAQRLLAGTASTDFAIGEATDQEPFGPANVRAVPQAGQGSRAVPPVRVGAAIIYVQRGGARLREAVYDVTVDAYMSNDLSVLAEHICRPSGIVSMAFQRDPDEVLWCRLQDGSLRGFTYAREQQVTGWHRHVLGGQKNGLPPTVAALCSIPSPDGTMDDVWLAVERTVGGVATTHIEVMGPSAFAGEAGYYHDVPTSREAAYLDCFKRGTHDEWLNGESAAALWDGRYVPPFVYDNGTPSIPDDTAYTASIIGLPYTSRLVTLPLPAQSPTGTGQNKTQRLPRVGLRLLNTTNVRVGLKGRPLDRREFRKLGDTLDERIALYSGDVLIDLDDDWTDVSQLEVQQDQPFPLTLVAIYPRMDVEAAR